MAMSDYEEALKEFNIVVQIRPASGDGHFMKAEAHRMLSQFESAQQGYATALKTDSRNALAMSYLGECYRNSGNPRIAITVLKDAIKLDPHLVVHM